MTHQALMSADTPNRLMPAAIYMFPEAWNEGQTLARNCQAQAGRFHVHKFPDGETLVTAKPNVPLTGQVVAIYRSLHDPNAKLVEVLLAANALRTLGAGKLILIAPYMPYMRQDRAFQPGQAISQNVIGHLLADAFDAIVTIQPHLHRTLSLSDVFGGVPALAISAGLAIGADLRHNISSSTVIMGPDEESEGLVREVADVLGVDWCVAKKSRQGDNAVVIELPQDFPISGRPVVIVDDIISSGGTAVTLAKALKSAGAGEIIVYAVHALFNADAATAMHQAGIRQIKSVTSVPHETNAIPAVNLICAALGVSP